MDKQVTTSKIVVRPFQSMAEPHATLKFGNVEIQLEYTVIRRLKLDWDSPRIRGITAAAIEEIALEMQADMKGELPYAHRDGEIAKYWIENGSHVYGLMPRHGEILDCEFTEKFPKEREHIEECPYGYGAREEIEKGIRKPYGGHLKVQQ